MYGCMYTVIKFKFYFKKNKQKKTQFLSTKIKNTY